MHDQGAVFVGILVQGVKFSDGLIKCLKHTDFNHLKTRKPDQTQLPLEVSPQNERKLHLTIEKMSPFHRSYRLSQAAGLVRIVEDFIVEDREVEGQTKTDGVCRLHVPFAYVESLLVRLLGVVRCICRQKSKPKRRRYLQCTGIYRLFAWFFLSPHCIAAVHKEAQHTDDTLLTLLIFPGCNLRQVSEIIAFHFQVEHLALRSGGVGDEIVVQ